MMIRMSIACAAMAVATLGAAAATALPVAPPGDAAKGKTVFARCAACHSVVPGKKGVGPSLAGVVGRPAAAMPGYSYSAALKNSKLVWNDATIARFVAGPSKLVPGTKMMAPPVTKPEDQANLVAYLKTVGSK
ncbi:c-type cytochrome [Sphingomonas qomolangmaensis]|uniref:C-type cytochrome n=1 Tax=Sphingomonas qomolangmaensis TaxID=2918765 RepID=A0ABY5L9M3_9SPHN|nr:c-type cytochrome [Sphingomonas qomolangmaensis]UUL83137.1 c-type cytochrome [Sphingomonas qomolangmaensis]